MNSLGLAFLAGLLSVLSPCVLPLAPVVLGAAMAQHRLGAVALALGLAMSFVVVGLTIATFGFAIGLDGGLVRSAGAVVLLAVGIVLIVPPLQTRLAAAAGPLTDRLQRRLGPSPRRGLGGQFALGLALGLVWSPCVGPTLGAASMLAAQGQDLAQVALTMLLFGIGAALPLLLLGRLSRHRLLRWRGTLLRTGGALKAALGVLLVAMTGAILFDVDRSIESRLVDASPQWLTALTTRF